LTVLAIFGPTGVGKTGVAIALAAELRRRGEDPIAINCDALQVYEGLGVLTGAASAAEREWLEHRLLGFVPVSRDFSVGDYMPLAHAEVDAALAAGRTPIVVGGTGLYLRAALAQLSLVKAAPGAEDSELWSPETRHPTTIFGLDMERAALYGRIDARAAAIVGAGALEEVRRAEELGLGAVGVEDPQLSDELRVLAALQQQHSVGADAEMRVAEPLDPLLVQLPGEVLRLQDQVIVAQRLPLLEFHGRQPIRVMSCPRHGVVKSSLALAILAAVCSSLRSVRSIGCRLGILRIQVSWRRA